MQVLTSYMLMTYKAPNAVGSAFYLAAQCHVPPAERDKFTRTNASSKAKINTFAARNSP